MSQSFKGDYLEINKNPKYQKLNSVVEEKILLADFVNKINRANGKVSYSANESYFCENHVSFLYTISLNKQINTTCYVHYLGCT